MASLLEDVNNGKKKKFNKVQAGPGVVGHNLVLSSSTPSNNQAFSVPLPTARPYCGLKSVDTQVAVGLNAGGASSLLNVLCLGYTGFQRIGRQITLVALEMRAAVYPNGNQPTSASNSRTYDYGRIQVVYDKQPNGAAISWANVLGFYGSGGAVTSFSSPTGTSVSSPTFLFPHPDGFLRYDVLYDRALVLPDYSMGTSTTLPIRATGPYPSSEADWSIHETLDLEQRVVTYNGGNTGTIADIRSGALWVLYGTTLFSQCWQLQGQFRVWYYG